MTIDFTSTSRLLEDNGLHIHFHDVGVGDAVVLLHGGGPGASGWSNFQRNIALLAECFRVLAVDLPNFGRTTKVGPVAPLYEYHARVIARWLDALELPSAHFVGNSLGAGVALKLALDQPTRVRKIVLMGPGGGLPLFAPAPSEGMKAIFACYDEEGPTARKVEAFLKLMVFDASVITEALVEERLAAALDPEVLSARPFRSNAAKFGAEPLWKADLHALDHPVMIICGREDRVMPFDSALAYARQIRRCRLVVLPECGHWAQWEKPDEFNALTANFLHATFD